MLNSPRHHEAIARLRRAGCVFAEDEAADLLSTARDDGELETMLLRREAGAPLEHVLGWARFDGLRVVVRETVFIPRQRSEALVEIACRLLSPEDELVEICCGSGALALACATRVPGIRVTASDLDPVAVACAAENLGEGATVVIGDLFAAIPSRLRGRVRVVLANVPYVPTEGLGLMPRDVLDGEPETTRDGGADGLDVFRRVVAEAPGWLAIRGALISELHLSQAPTAMAACVEAGLDGSIVEGEHGQCAVVATRSA